MALPVRRSAASPVRRWDPFRELDDFRERMSRMLDQTFGGLPDLAAGDGWSPLVDIEETDDAYVFEADLPAVKHDDVDVEVEGNELRISGEVQERERTGTLRRQTRMTGRFDYRAALPHEVDADKVEASLADGVLTVRVPKSERSQPKRIEVKG